MRKLLDELRHYSQWERDGVIVMLAILGYLILLAIGRWLKRRMDLPLGLAYQAAAAATGLYLATGLIEPGLSWRREFATVAVLAGVRALLPLVNRVLVFRLAGERRAEPLPKFLREVLSLFIFIVAVLLVLQLGYHVQIPGLIAGSGIAALAIEAAVQHFVGAQAAIRSATGERPSAVERRDRRHQAGKAGLFIAGHGLPGQREETVFEVVHGAE